MIECVVLHPQPADPDAFEEHYPQVHQPLGAALPGLRRREFARTVPRGDSAPPFYRIAELYFDDQAAMEAAFASPEGTARARRPRRLRPGGDGAGGRSRRR